MKKIFLADWHCRKGELFSLAFLILGIYAIGSAFLLLVMYFADADYIPFATMMALSMLVMYAILFAQQFSCGWHLAGAMGAVRKDYCRYMILRQLVITSIGYGMILILRFAEDGVVRAVFGAVPNMLDLNEIYRPGVAAVILTVSLIYQLLAGALTVRFGQQGNTGVFLIVMAAILVVTRAQGLRAYIAALPSAIPLLGAGIVAAACLVFEARTFQTMAVKS